MVVEAQCTPSTDLISNFTRSKIHRNFRSRCLHQAHVGISVCPAQIDKEVDDAHDAGIVLHARCPTNHVTARTFHSANRFKIGIQKLRTRRIKDIAVASQKFVASEREQGVYTFKQKSTRK